MEERILARLLFGVLMLLTLATCGAQPANQEDAPREAGASEETASSEEGSVGEETAEPNTPTTVAVRTPEPSQNTTSSPAVGASGMVSSANPFATRAGLEVLSEGGNAFDAAVAVGAALGVAEPMMSGVGGYGAIVLYDAEEGRTWFLDTGSRTPAGLDPSVFRSSAPNYAENRCGAKAVATPGNVNAWETMWEEYGELEWRSLFDPAIELAEGGFPVGDVTAGWIEASFSYFPEHAQGIYGRGGVPLRAGETLVQEDLARSLELIGEQGAGELYEGELARTIDSTMRGYAGYLTADLEPGKADTVLDEVCALARFTDEHAGHLVGDPPQAGGNRAVQLARRRPQQRLLPAHGHGSLQASRSGEPGLRLRPGDSPDAARLSALGGVLCRHCRGHRPFAGVA